MEIEPTYIEAEAYACQLANERHYVKITFVGTGMFINSFSVQPSKYEGQPLWVQPPKHRQRNGWVATVDFDKSYALWQIIEQKAVEAVRLCVNCNDSKSKSGVKDTVVDVTGEPINLDDIPF